MHETLILISARKAILARLATLGRHFCQDDINEMVSMTVERFYTRGAYDPCKSAVQTYVSSIAVRVVYDFVKAADRDRGRLSDIDTFGISELFEDDWRADSRLLEQERDALLEKAADRLSPRQQLLFCLLHDELPYRDIASRLDMSVSGVAVEVHRMKKNLRESVQSAA